MVDFDGSYKERVECPKVCDIMLNRVRMEEVHEFISILVSIQCKPSACQNTRRLVMACVVLHNIAALRRIAIFDEAQLQGAGWLCGRVLSSWPNG